MTADNKIVFLVDIKIDLGVNDYGQVGCLPKQDLCKGYSEPVEILELVK